MPFYKFALLKETHFQIRQGEFMKEVVLANLVLNLLALKIKRPWSDHNFYPILLFSKKLIFKIQVEFMKEVVMSKFRSPSSALNISSPQSNQVLLPHFLFSNKVIFKINKVTS